MDAPDTTGELTRAGDGSVPPSISDAGSEHPGRIVCVLRRGAPTTVVIVLLAALAVRRYMFVSNADALLPALISTQQWTLFYWGQDRLASIVPLLTMPIRDPVWNFEIQSLVIASAFFGLGAVFVSYHAWVREDRARPLEHAIATGVTGLLVMAPMHLVAGYRFTIEQLYFVSVLAWVGAVWTWNRRSRFPVAAILLLIASLLNPSLLLASPLVWLLDDRPEGRLRRSAGFVGTSAAAFVATDIAARLFATGPDADNPYDEFRFDHLTTGVRLVAGNVAGSMRDHLATTIVVAVVAVVAISTRHLVPRRAAIYGAVPVFSAVWFVAFSINGWVILNSHEFRYFYPLYVTFMMFVAAAVTEVVLATRRWRPSIEQPGHRARAIAILETAAVIAASSVAVYTAHRTDIWALGTSADQVAAAREYEARLIAGNYWNVWPTVVAGRAEGVPLLGVTFRSDPISDDIRSELDTAAHTVGSAVVVCSAVDPATCVGYVNERSSRPWAVDEVLREWPLVIRIVPAP